MSVVWVVSCQLCHMVHGSLWLTHEAMHEPWSSKQGHKPQAGSQDPMTHKRPIRKPHAVAYLKL